MNICLFAENEINSPLSLKDERAKHIVKVLHKNVGDDFKAGIINGKVGTATITKIDDVIEFDFKAESDRLPPNPLIMIIGFPRPIQLKRLLRDIAALGVKEVHLTGTELGEKSYMQSNLAEHDAAYKLLIDGTVQAGTTSVPELYLHKTLKECVEAISSAIRTGNLSGDETPNCTGNLGSNGTPKLTGNLGEVTLLALDNVNPKCSLIDAVKKSSIRTRGATETPICARGATETPICARGAGVTYVAAIGSERGWTDNERKLLEDAGFIRCGMGKRIMRTETAATVSASIILAESGALC